MEGNPQRAKAGAFSLLEGGVLPPPLPKQRDIPGAVSKPGPQRSCLIQTWIRRAKVTKHSPFNKATHDRRHAEVLGPAAAAA